MPKISIASCKSYDKQTCRAALEKVISDLGGINFIKKGSLIAVKPNLVAALAPEKAATTHPCLLAALCEILKEKGHRVVVGDSPGGLFTPSRLKHVYRETGVFACEEHGAELNLDTGHEEVFFPEARVAKSFLATAYLLRADYIINFCKLKTHGMMDMSAAAKNMFGAVPGVVKPQYHYKYPDKDDFAGMIVDINEYFSPKVILNLCDAVWCMEGNGPTAGNPKFMGAVMGSRSPHELDLLCAWLLGFKAGEIPTLREAAARGLIAPGEGHETPPEIKTFTAQDFARAKKTVTVRFKGDSNGVFFKALDKTITFFLTQKPKLYKKDCTGCGECYRVCPAKAITMKNKKPKIDKSKCISCFCCQEFCPKGAMRVGEPAVIKLIDYFEKLIEK